ncbi:MAG: late competence development ComFB family protein [Spirochaetota bacterium]
MEIRNLMEEAVLTTVDELFLAGSNKDKNLGFCTCGQCRLDVACFVLNRIEPEYIVSSRGFAYSERDFQVAVQKRADIISLARDGWSRVSHSPRSTSEHDGAAMVSQLPEGPAFNLPTIRGRAFNGLNFEPLATGEVQLYIDGALAPMADPNWQNPFVLARATVGTFIFWVCPVSAPSAGAKRSFTLEVRAVVPGLETASRYFELEIEADKEANSGFDHHGVHKLPDLLLFAQSEEQDD